MWAQRHAVVATHWECVGSIKPLTFSTSLPVLHWRACYLLTTKTRVLADPLPNNLSSHHPADKSPMLHNALINAHQLHSLSSTCAHTSQWENSQPTVVPLPVTTCSSTIYHTHTEFIGPFSAQWGFTRQHACKQARGLIRNILTLCYNFVLIAILRLRSVWTEEERNGMIKMGILTKMGELSGQKKGKMVWSKWDCWLRCEREREMVWSKWECWLRCEREKWYEQNGNVDWDVAEKWYDQNGNVDWDVRTTFLNCAWNLMLQNKSCIGLNCKFRYMYICCICTSVA